MSVIDAPRTGVKYAAALKKALDDWNIPMSAIAVGLSDHEGACVCVRVPVCVVRVCVCVCACIVFRPSRGMHCKRLWVVDFLHLDVPGSNSGYLVELFLIEQRGWQKLFVVDVVLTRMS